MNKFDVFSLKMSADKQTWYQFEPQGVIDYENDTEFMPVDVESSIMLDKYFGIQGA